MLCISSPLPTLASAGRCDTTAIRDVSSYAWHFVTGVNQRKRNSQSFSFGCDRYKHDITMMFEPHEYEERYGRFSVDVISCSGIYHSHSRECSIFV